MAIGIIGAILYFFNPENAIWLPKCPIYILTGYECPGCGIQRALHQLLHLNIKKALGYNPFLAIALPYIILLLITRFVPANRLKRLRRICYHTTTIRVYTALTVIWWVVRNL